MTKINKVDEATKVAIKRKSAYSLPNRPSEQGMKADDIKKAFWQPVIDVTNSTLSELDRVVDETNREIERVASETNIAISSGALFDKVIKTQEEFEELIASPTWLDAVSVAFVGDGGSLKFIFLDTGQTFNAGIKIPRTVLQIEGFNNAKIEVPNFSYNENTRLAAMWYEYRESDIEYSIKNISLFCVSDVKGRGFYNFSNMTNCYSFCRCETEAMAFYKCTNLFNCTAYGNGSSTGGANSIGYGFLDCDNLINCNGRGYGDDDDYGEGYGYGFHSCKHILNCAGHGLAYSYAPTQFAFYNCSYANGCSLLGGYDKRPIWGGTTIKRDDASCDLD